MKYLLFLMLPFFLFAEIPQTISWQGVLTDAEDNFLNGNYDITVKLYDAYTDGTELWSETHNDLEIDNGLTNIILGSITPFDLPFNNQYWLEITVGSNAPLNRIALNSTPYSFYSKKTNNVFTGDSLVLKDSTGETRFILNPNTGTFKMMDNDTAWYSIGVNSPPIFNFLMPDNVEVVEDGNTTKIYRDGKISEELQEYVNEDGDQVAIQKYYDTEGNLAEYEEFVTYYETDPSGERHIVDVYVAETYDEDGNPIRLLGEEYRDDELTNEYTYDYGQKTHEKNVEITEDEDEYTERETEKNYKNDIVIQFIDKVITYFKDDDGNYESDYKSETNKSYVSGNEYKRDFESVAVDGTNGNTSSVYETEETKYFPGSDEYSYTERKVNGRTTSYETTKNGKLYDYTTYSDNSTRNRSRTNHYDEQGNKLYEYDEEFDKTNRSRSTRFDDNNGNETSMTQDGDSFDFDGDVNVAGGEFSSEGPKKFKITHPNDNTKYLQHAAIESNEVLNIYSGNATTGSDSLATVTLPDYFDDINTDFRYQLTIIGTNFARAIVYSEISNNEFTIKTDMPNINVSWQITATRNDAYMQNNPFEDEIAK